MFSDNELAYLESQRLGRIATVSDEGQPDVSPVGFEFDGRFFYIGGGNNKASRKYKNVAGGNSQVAIVVDDLASVDPWKPRGIRVYGIADIIERDGYAGSGSYLRITPKTSWSWGIEGPNFVEGKFNVNKIDWES